MRELLHLLVAETLEQKHWVAVALVIEFAVETAEQALGAVVP